MGRWLIAVLLLGFATSAAAGCWLDLPVRSFHTDRTAGYNEANWGFGVDCQVSERFSVVAGQYRNSLWETTRYVGVDFMPWRSGRVEFGFRTSIVTGYSEDAQPLPPVPLLKWRGEKWGLGLIAVPPVPGILKEGVVGFWVSRQF